MPKTQAFPFKPDYSAPPGETIQEHLDTKGWTQVELARRMGRPFEQVNRLIKGHVRITPESACQLQRVLGTAAEFWMMLDVHWQLYRYKKQCAILRVEP